MVNPSFEADTGAPYIHEFSWNKYGDYLRKEEGKENVMTDGWFRPSGGTPDYVNSDRSHFWGYPLKTARTGKGRVGIIAGISQNNYANWNMNGIGYSEYIETKLKQPLDSGKLYCVRYYIALDKRSNFAARGFGAALTQECLVVKNSQPFYGSHPTPQVVSYNDHYVTSDEGWVMICDTFIAKGGERFLTLGCFFGEIPRHVHKVKKSEHGSLRTFALNKYADYWIDDVSLTEVMPEEVLCSPPRDSIARNNIVLVIDVSKSMQKDSLIEQVTEVILPFIRALGPNDRVSLIAYNDEVQLLAENHSAADLPFFEQALRQLKSGGGSNAAGALHAAYKQIEKGMIGKGNNRVVMFTDGKIYLPKGTKKEVAAMAEEKGVRLEVLFFGDEVPKQVERIAKTGNGEVQAVSKTSVHHALMKTGPNAFFDTPYSGRKAGTIALFQFFTKIALPALILLVLI
ncbi:MAG: vWA domain-containing protein [Bacteroidia bacterium]